ncbi:MAG: hypothetical protein HY305_02065 [Sphingobacteriales bacterium]|nr:hypothetical protein [Sphingobacteriales bacterium]
MKKIYFLLLLTIAVVSANAQGEFDQGNTREQKIEALKVAFISRELDLTPDEAQKFWPVYNQYAKEIRATVKEDNGDVLERDEKVLNIRKRYKDQFIKVVGEERMNKLFGAEARFRQLLIKRMQHRQDGQGGGENRRFQNRE